MSFHNYDDFFYFDRIKYRMTNVKIFTPLDIEFMYIIKILALSPLSKGAGFYYLTGQECQSLIKQ